MRHLIVCALVLLAGCAAAQPRYVPPSPPPVYLPVDSDWVFLTVQTQVRRMGSWNQHGDNRHFWARFWSTDGTEYVIYEMIANCSERTEVDLTITKYDSKTGSVKASWSAPSRLNNPAWADAVVPGSVAETAFNFVCQPPQ